MQRRRRQVEPSALSLACWRESGRKSGGAASLTHHAWTNFSSSLPNSGGARMRILDILIRVFTCMTVFVCVVTGWFLWLRHVSPTCLTANGYLTDLLVRLSRNILGQIRPQTLQRGQCMPNLDTYCVTRKSQTCALFLTRDSNSSAGLWFICRLLRC